MGKNKFGQTTYFLMVSFKDDDMDKDKCEEFTKFLVKEIKMKKAYAPVFFDYPYKGKGGKGFTFIQPITDSYITMDYWKNLGGGYVTVCSCKNFYQSKAVDSFKKFGMEIINIGSDEVGI